MQQTLDCLRPGQSARVGGLFIDSRPMRRRLMDLGFTRGATVRCLFCAPLGEMRAYLIRGAVIALRREDAALIQTAPEACA